MSFSNDIIQGKYEKVAQTIRTGLNINYLDEYGFTPLIESCVANHTGIATLLLQHGAEVNAVDVSGQTALHWAIDNDNLELVSLLLKYKADPNAFTSYGQPPLFLPMMRENKAMQRLLLEHKADQDFAKDYINAKLIGHRFELQGVVKLFASNGFFIPIDLEGFFLEFTVGIIRDSLERFANSFVANRLDLPVFELKQIIQAMRNASELRTFAHYNAKVENNIPTIQKLIQSDLLLLPVSYAGHAITFVKHGDFLAKCDRGVHRMIDPIAVNSIGKQSGLNLDFIKKLLFDKQTEYSMKTGISEHLALKPFVKLPLRHQVTGNCSWANVEASIPTMLFMLLYNKNQDPKTIQSIVREVMKFYVVWKEWDKDRALEECLRDFKSVSPNRRKAKASLLGAVFFQACDYRNARDMKRALKIIEILKLPEYRFVLSSYVKVFMQSGKGGARGRLFHRLLEACNIEPTLFD